MYSDLPSWWPGALDFLGISEMVYAKSKTFVPHGTPPQFRRSVISVNATRTNYQYRTDVDNLAEVNLKE